MGTCTISCGWNVAVASVHPMPKPLAERVILSNRGAPLKHVGLLETPELPLLAPYGKMEGSLEKQQGAGT